MPGCLNFIVTPGRTATLVILLELKEFRWFLLSVRVCIWELREHLDLQMAKDALPNISAISTWMLPMTIC